MLTGSVYVSVTVAAAVVSVIFVVVGASLALVAGVAAIVSMIIG